MNPWDITEGTIAEAVAGALARVGDDFEDVADIDVHSVTTSHRGNVVSVTVEYDDEGHPGFLEFADAGQLPLIRAPAVMSCGRMANMHNL